MQKKTGVNSLNEIAFNDLPTMVLYSIGEELIPCKLVRLFGEWRNNAVECSTESVTVTVKTGQYFRNCMKIEGNRILLSLSKDIVLFTKELKQLSNINVRDVHPYISETLCCEPIESSFETEKLLIATWMDHR